MSQFFTFTTITLCGGLFKLRTMCVNNAGCGAVRSISLFQSLCSLLFYDTCPTQMHLNVSKVGGFMGQNMQWFCGKMFSQIILINSMFVNEMAEGVR